MPTQFSWVPFYREVAGRVLQYEDRQDELIELLAEMKGIGLNTVKINHQLPNGAESHFTKIDPFTFFANWNRGGNDNRLKVCAYIANKWQLTTQPPGDFDGIPTVRPDAAWFVPFDNESFDDDVAILWQIARLAYDSTPETLDQQVFSSALKIWGIGVAKLTMGLFWINPTGMLAMDGVMLPYLKARGVTWDDKAMRNGDLSVYRDIISQAHEKISYEHPRISRDAYLFSTGKLPNMPPAPLQESSLPEFPLNTILYGPPGTGKTYTSVAKAVAIIKGAAPEDRDECMERFEELRTSGQIGFVTFHQSFSYEEFIEGLRPVVDEDTEGGARYAVRDGIFKQVALRALGAMLEPAQTGGVSFEQLWETFLQEIGDAPEHSYAGLSANTKWRMEETASGIRGRNLKGVDPYDYSSCRKAEVEQVWEYFRDTETINTGSVKAVLGRRRRLIPSIFTQLKRIEKDLLAQGEATPPLPEANFNTVEAARSYLKGSAGYLLSPKAKRFVLIVDEINRGNISKIFGELITLLEADKRLGTANALHATLPYSGDTFALPLNLYLLGTMNTADKSLALLDVALRRRFTFEEIRPDFAICQMPNALMQQVLKELNKRIMLVLDREHRIGHAFFMDVQTAEAFNKTFTDKIVPLLQEYFYNDWEGLRAVLGEKEAGHIVGTMKPIDGIRARNHFAWWHDLDKPTPDFLSILGKNYGISTGSSGAGDGSASGQPQAQSDTALEDAPVAPDSQ